MTAKSEAEIHQTGITNAADLHMRENDYNFITASNDGTRFYRHRRNGEMFSAKLVIERVG